MACHDELEVLAFLGLLYSCRFWEPPAQSCFLAFASKSECGMALCPKTLALPKLIASCGLVIKNGLSFCKTFYSLAYRAFTRTNSIDCSVIRRANSAPADELAPVQFIFCECTLGVISDIVNASFAPNGDCDQFICCIIGRSSCPLYRSRHPPMYSSTRVTGIQ